MKELYSLGGVLAFAAWFANTVYPGTDYLRSIWNSVDIIGVASSNVSKARHVDPVSTIIPLVASGQCLPESALAGATVRILGAYEGGIETDYEFADDDDGHAVGSIKIGGRRSGPPVVLVLTAYDPVVWDFSSYTGGAVQGVIVYGYHHQAVANLNPKIPVRIVTQDYGKGAACGDATYAYEGGAQLDRLSQQVAMVTGLKPSTFDGRYDPRSLSLDEAPVPVSGTLEVIGEVRASAALIKSGVAPGNRGITQLINEGAIRPAGSADVASWIASATRKSPSGSLAPVQPQYLRTNKAFVVLKPFTVPKGMYGANSATFIIPAGQKKPDDTGSHNNFYFIDSGTCMGTAPSC